MSAFFQKHLERWAKVCTLGKEKVSAADCSGYRFSHAASGALNLSVPFAGKEWLLHSEIDPLKEAQITVESLSLKYADTLYVFGVGLGYFYEAAKAWLHEKPERSLVFLEPRPEVIHRFLETEQAGSLLFDPQAALYLFSETDPALCRLDRIVLLYASAHPTEHALTALPAYNLMHAGAIYEWSTRISFFHTMYAAGLSESQNINTPFFRNFFWNALYLPESYYAIGLKDKFVSIPAIICGAGPSLDKNIDLLRTLKDRALIFAGGTALNALNAKGVMPHFGVGIDPNFAQFTRAVAHDGFELPFFYRTRMLHEALEIMQGEKLYIPGNAGYEVGKWMEKELGLSSPVDIAEGFNVLNFALGIAQMLGCNPLICVGIDLAYTGGRSYPTGLIPHPIHDQKTTFGTKGFDDEVITRTDIYGSPILTLWKWLAESLWYNSFSKAHPGITLINCTEGGIGFPPVPNLALSVLKEQYLKKKYDLEAMIHGEIQNSSFPANVTKTSVRNLLDRLCASLKRAQEILQKCLDQVSSEDPPEKRQEICQEAMRELQSEDAFQAILKPFHEQFLQKGDLARSRASLDQPEKQVASPADWMDSEHYKQLQAAAKAQEQLMQKIFDYGESTRQILQKWQAENPQEENVLRQKYATLQEEVFQLNYAEQIDPSLDVQKSFYPSGAIKTKVHYKEGRLHGPSLFFTEEGQLLAQSWFWEGLKEGESCGLLP